MTLTATTPTSSTLDGTKLRTLPLLEAIPVFAEATEQPLPQLLPIDITALPPFPHYSTYEGLVLSCHFRWDALRLSHVDDATIVAWLSDCYRDLVALARPLSIPEQSTPAYAQYA